MAFHSCYCLLIFVLFFGPAHSMDPDLFALVRQGNYEQLVQLFDTQSNKQLFAKCRDEEGNTLLHVVTDARIASLLIRGKVPVNAVNRLESTPLHTLLWDTTHADLECIGVLLDAGADLKAINANKQNPVHLIASKSPEFIQRIISYVPHGSIKEKMKHERRRMADTFLLSLRKSEDKLYSQLPKVLKKMLLEYCLLPPYKSTGEHELVNALLFEKLDILSNVLSAQDHLDHTPGSLEQRYATIDRSKLLDPLRVYQFVPDIIASIGRLVTLTLSYSLEQNQLTSVPLPSTVPKVLVVDPE